MLLNACQFQLGISMVGSAFYRAWLSLQCLERLATAWFTASFFV